MNEKANQKSSGRPIIESDNQITFGGRGGGFSTIGDVGGKQLIFWSGTLIDAIQIGDQKYGGGGGGQGPTAKIPANGKIYLLQMRTLDGVLCYFKAKVGDVDVEAGNLDPSGTIAVTLPKVPVRFAGVCHGTCVDSLFFDVVDD